MAEKNGGGDPPAEEAEEEEENHGGADGGASPQKETDDDGEKKKKKKHSDPELLMCLLQPCPADSDPEYIGTRRLLLSRKSQSSILRRLDWRCNGKGYVAFRNYIRRPRNWEKDSLRTPSLQTTPGNSGRWIQPPSPLSLLCDVESWTPGRDGSQPSSRRSFGSSTSDNDRLRRQGEQPAYSFVGMHCVFDQCRASVTVLKFGHMSSDLLAYGASDGTLTVCTVSDPPSILKHLNGHSKDVTDFDFSSNNQYIASSSVDKTVRVWEISKGLCIRVIYGVSPQLCIRFHPVNNNFLSVGNADKEITVFNFSTGRTIHKTSFDSQVTAMDHAHTGQIIFCGDGTGCIYSVSMNSHTGVLSRSHRHRSSSRQKSPVTTVEYRSFSLLARGPVLLTCTQDGSLSFFSVALEIQGYLTLRCSLKLTPRIYNIRASFCPLLSLEKGEYIVAGSEDSNVYFYDLTRPKHTCVNKLQGHRFPVIGVAWNHGENLLASSDFYGTVIVWKRSKAG
ncbi:putative transcription factor WD40-like family [Rosa chinensis]|uniref:Putative transcription factor WD40-like family n=1 Tax=Rosa chinensis TaxID=74649 RepID=A0A2P6PPP8_ROSCH|nr:WD repeat-containing protein 13 [Rosa chinensis]PRQ23913.1 putative transcription factor WD40-like family [Rosa chinensis]